MPLPTPLPMACRGFLRHSLRAHTLAPPFRSFASKPPLPRTYTNSKRATTPSNATKRTAQSAQPTARSAVKQSPSAYSSPGQTLITHLASQPGPTTIYASKGSNHRLLCFSVGGACITYALYQFYDVYLTEHPGLWWGIPVMFGGISIMIFALGSWITLSGRRVISRIQAIPSTREGGGRTVRIRLVPERGRLGRLFGSGAKEAWLEDVRLLESVQDASPGSDWRTGRRMSPGEWKMQEAEEDVIVREKGGSVGIQRRVSGGLAGFGRMINREGFVGVEVRNKSGAWEGWRIDVQRGIWGRELEKLIQVRD